MAKIKLTYFDFHGGRGEVARLAMSIGGIAFEDDRVSFAQWKARKKDAVYGAIPILEVDGRDLAQSCGINRYVGKLSELYPEDSWQAARCDEIMDAIEDIAHLAAPTFSIEDEEEKKTARQDLANGPLTLYLKSIAGRLEEAGGEYFADGRLTIADLRVFVWLRYLRSGKLDYMPTDIVDRVAPKLVAHFERVNDDERVRAYYASVGGY